MVSLKQWAVLAIVSISLLLVTMDLGILFVALPSLSADLNVSPIEKIWIINAYTLLVAGLLPLCGTLGDRKGYKKIFMIGMITFGLASLLCAYAPTSGILILGRALLAVGAACMLPTTMPIIYQIFETEKQQALAIGIWSAMAATGAAAGPMLGGILLEFFWWGSVFLINIPFVLVGSIVSFALIPKDGYLSEDRIDILSVIFVTFGLAGPLYMISTLSAHGGVSGDITTAVIIGALGVIALILFWQRQLMISTPLVDIRLFQNKRFTSGVIAGAVTLFSLAGYELVMIEKMQYVNGLSPLGSSLYIIPISFVAMFAGPVTGWFITKLGYLHVMVWAVLLTGAGMLCAIITIDHHSYLVTAIPLAVAGFGLGAVMTASANIVMISVPEHEIGSASSLQHVFYQIGHGLGVGLLGSLTAYLYRFYFSGDFKDLGLAENSGVDEARLFAMQLESEFQQSLLKAISAAFDSAFVWVAGIAGAVLILTALLLWVRTIKLIRKEGRT